MKEEIENIVENTNSSDELSNLLIAELDKIIEDIKSGKCDESFLYYAAELVKKYQYKRSLEKEEAEARIIK